MTSEREPTTIEQMAIHSWNTRHRDTGPSWANIGQQNAWAKDLEIDAMLAAMRELHSYLAEDQTLSARRLTARYVQSIIDRHEGKEADFTAERRSRGGG